MKKCMAILLAAVLVLSLSVSALAIDGNPQQQWEWGTTWGNPTRDQGTVAREVPARNTVVIEIGPMEEPEEDNPTTGAPVLNFIPAVAVIAGATLLLKKKK